jgi:hypothetical protein
VFLGVRASGWTATCNLLGGDVTYKFGDEAFNAVVDVTVDQRIMSFVCARPDDPNPFQLGIFAWHVPALATVDMIELWGTVPQLSATVFKWSSESRISRFFNG